MPTDTALAAVLSPLMTPTATPTAVTTAPPTSATWAFAASPCACAGVSSTSSRDLAGLAETLPKLDLTDARASDAHHTHPCSVHGNRRHTHSDSDSRDDGREVKGNGAGSTSCHLQAQDRSRSAATASDSEAAGTVPAATLEMILRRLAAVEAMCGSLEKENQWLGQRLATLQSASPTSVPICSVTPRPANGSGGGTDGVGNTRQGTPSSQRPSQSQGSRRNSFAYVPRQAGENRYSGEDGKTPLSPTCPMVVFPSMDGLGLGESRCGTSHHSTSVRATPGAATTAAATGSAAAASGSTVFHHPTPPLTSLNHAAAAGRRGFSSFRSTAGTVPSVPFSPSLVAPSPGSAAIARSRDTDSTAGLDESAGVSFAPSAFESIATTPRTRVEAGCDRSDDGGGIGGTEATSAGVDGDDHDLHKIGGSSAAAANTATRLFGANNEEDGDVAANANVTTAATGETLSGSNGHSNNHNSSNGGALAGTPQRPTIVRKLRSFSHSSPSSTSPAGLSAETFCEGMTIGSVSLTLTQEIAKVMLGLRKLSDELEDARDGMNAERAKRRGLAQATVHQLKKISAVLKTHRRKIDTHERLLASTADMAAITSASPSTASGVTAITTASSSGAPVSTILLSGDRATPPGASNAVKRTAAVDRDRFTCDKGQEKTTVSSSSATGADHLSPPQLPRQRINPGADAIGATVAFTVTPSSETATATTADRWPEGSATDTPYNNSKTVWMASGGSGSGTGKQSSAIPHTQQLQWRRNAAEGNESIHDIDFPAPQAVTVAPLQTAPTSTANTTAMTSMTTVNTSSMMPAILDITSVGQTLPPLTRSEVSARSAPSLLATVTHTNTNTNANATTAAAVAAVPCTTASSLSIATTRNVTATSAPVSGPLLSPSTNSFPSLQLRPSPLDESLPAALTALPRLAPIPRVASGYASATAAASTTVGSPSPSGMTTSRMVAVEDSEGTKKRRRRRSQVDAVLTRTTRATAIATANHNATGGSVALGKRASSLSSRSKRHSGASSAANTGGVGSVGGARRLRASLSTSASSASQLTASRGPSQSPASSEEVPPVAVGATGTEKHTRGRRGGATTNANARANASGTTANQWKLSHSPPTRKLLRAEISGSDATASLTGSSAAGTSLTSQHVAQPQAVKVPVVVLMTAAAAAGAGTSPLSFARPSTASAKPTCTHVKTTAAPPAAEADTSTVSPRLPLSTGSPSTSGNRSFRVSSHRGSAQLPPPLSVEQLSPSPVARVAAARSAAVFGGAGGAGASTASGRIGCPGTEEVAKCSTSRGSAAANAVTTASAAATIHRRRASMLTALEIREGNSTTVLASTGSADDRASTGGATGGSAPRSLPPLSPAATAGVSAGSGTGAVGTTTGSDSTNPNHMSTALTPEDGRDPSYSPRGSSSTATAAPSASTGVYSSLDLSEESARLLRVAASQSHSRHSHRSRGPWHTQSRRHSSLSIDIGATQPTNVSVSSPSDAAAAPLAQHQQERQRTRQSAAATYGVGSDDRRGSDTRATTPSFLYDAHTTSVSRVVRDYELMLGGSGSDSGSTAPPFANVLAALPPAAISDGGNSSKKGSCDNDHHRISQCNGTEDAVVTAVAAVDTDPVKSATSPTSGCAGHAERHARGSISSVSTRSATENENADRGDTSSNPGSQTTASGSAALPPPELMRCVPTTTPSALISRGSPETVSGTTTTTTDHASDAFVDGSTSCRAPTVAAIRDSSPQLFAPAVLTTASHSATSMHKHGSISSTSDEPTNHVNGSGNNGHADGHPRRRSRNRLAMNQVTLGEPGVAMARRRVSFVSPSPHTADRERRQREEEAAMKQVEESILGRMMRRAAS